MKYIILCNLYTCYSFSLWNNLITIFNSQEVSEFRKLLKYLNDDLSPAVCLFTIVNMSWAISGIIWLLNLDTVDTGTEPVRVISVLNQLLWLSAAVVPFIQVSIQLENNWKLFKKVRDVPKDTSRTYNYNILR